MSRYWGAYDTDEYDDDGYRDCSSCESCGNDCSGRLCSICQQDKQYDAPDGKSAEWEWERQKRERAKEQAAWLKKQQVARQEQLKVICVENGRHWYIMGESACCVRGSQGTTGGGSMTELEFDCDDIHETGPELRAIHEAAKRAREKPGRAEARMRHALEEIETLAKMEMGNTSLAGIRQRVEWGLRPWSDSKILTEWDDAGISEGVAYKMLGVARLEARAMLEERIIDRT